MGFHEVRFPVALSFGSSGGPERRTEIVALTNGFEERNSPWEHSRRRYDAGVGLRSLADLRTVISFFEARRGQLFAFRWKDWADWTSGADSGTPSAMDETIGTGDGQRRVFTLSKSYKDLAGHYTRPIHKPIEGSIAITVDGSELVDGWHANAATGEIIFDVAPSDGRTITAGFAFDVPVRFDTDRLMISVESFNAGNVPSIPVVEVRL